MSTTMKKTLLISLIIFLTIIGAVAVVYIVRKPTVTSLPTPTPTPIESPTTAPIFVVEPPIACSTTFVVACAPQKHKVCNTTTFACEEVAGPGANTCTTDANCKTATHHVCNTTTFACEIVDGVGEDTCTTDASCVVVSPTPSISPSPTPSQSPTPSPSTPPVAALDCVAKKMYMDDSRNRAGFYYMENEILDTNTLQNGQTIVYNVVTKNAGGNSAPDTTITDVLASSLTYIDGDSDCIYDATTRVVTCTIGTLSANSEAQRSFRVQVAATGTVSIANTAEVTSTNGQRDSCSIRVDATGMVIVAASPAPTTLPVAGVFEVTAGTIGIGFILLVLGALGLLLI